LGSCSVVPLAIPREAGEATTPHFIQHGAGGSAFVSPKVGWEKRARFVFFCSPPKPRIWGQKGQRDGYEELLGFSQTPVYTGVSNLPVLNVSAWVRSTCLHVSVTGCSLHVTLRTIIYSLACILGGGTVEMYVTVLIRVPAVAFETPYLCGMYLCTPWVLSYLLLSPSLYLCFTVA
jgi:hypothetical protein